MSNQALWQMVAALLGIVADLIIKRIDKHGRKDTEK